MMYEEVVGSSTGVQSGCAGVQVKRHLLIKHDFPTHSSPRDTILNLKALLLLSRGLLPAQDAMAGCSGSVGLLQGDSQVLYLSKVPDLGSID